MNKGGSSSANRRESAKMPSSLQKENKKIKPLAAEIYLKSRMCCVQRDICTVKYDAGLSFQFLHCRTFDKLPCDTFVQQMMLQ